MKFEVGDAGEGGLDLFDADRQAAGDFGELALAQGVHKIADDAVFQGLFLAGPLQLQHQALTEVAGGDAGGMKSLNDLEHRDDFFRGVLVEKASSSTVALR